MSELENPPSASPTTNQPTVKDETDVPLPPPTENALAPPPSEINAQTSTLWYPRYDGELSPVHSA